MRVACPHCGQGTDEAVRDGADCTRWVMRFAPRFRNGIDQICPAVSEKSNAAPTSPCEDRGISTPAPPGPRGGPEPGDVVGSGPSAFTYAGAWPFLGLLPIRGLPDTNVEARRASSRG
jgi:hypothetical protein